MGSDNHPADPFFLTPCDVSHWMDLAMEALRTKSNQSSSFLSRLIKRSNRLHTMFSRGRGHSEYKGLASSLGLRAMETVTFATTRFFSSAFEQWDKIYKSYRALMEVFMQCRENEDDDCEQAKYEVRIGNPLSFAPTTNSVKYHRHHFLYYYSTSKSVNYIIIIQCTFYVMSSYRSEVKIMPSTCVGF